MADCSSFRRSERLERLCCSICCAVICASTAVFALTIVLSSSESESLPYVTSATLDLGDQHRDLVLLNTYRASSETSSQQRGGPQFLNISRSELRSFVAKKKRPPPPTTIMRLKAVRLFFAELDRAEHAANRRSTTNGRRHALVSSPRANTWPAADGLRERVFSIVVHVSTIELLHVHRQSYYYSRVLRTASTAFYLQTVHT